MPCARKFIFYFRNLQLGPHARGAAARTRQWKSHSHLTTPKKERSACVRCQELGRDTPPARAASDEASAQRGGAGGVHRWQAMPPVQANAQEGDASRVPKQHGLLQGALWPTGGLRCTELRPTDVAPERPNPEMRIDLEGRLRFRAQAMCVSIFLKKNSIILSIIVGFGFRVALCFSSRAANLGFASRLGFRRCRFSDCNA